MFKNFQSTMWSSYMLATLIANLLNLLHALRGKESIVFSVIQLLFLCWYLTGIVGYVRKKRIGTPGLWSIAFYISTFGTALTTINLIWTNGLLVAGVAISLTIAGMPMLYALWVYQLPHQPWWNDWAAYKNRQLIEDIALEDGPIELAAMTKSEQCAQQGFVVRLQKVVDQYQVAMTVTAEGADRAFQNEFWSLEAAIQFIEQQTPLRACDFAEASSRRMAKERAPEVSMSPSGVA